MAIPAAADTARGYTRAELVSIATSFGINPDGTRVIPVSESWGTTVGTNRPASAIAADIARLSGQTILYQPIG